MTLSIYNVQGRKVKTLIAGEQAAGIHRVLWDSSRMAAGVYLVRLQTEDGIFFGKVVKVR